MAVTTPFNPSTGRAETAAHQQPAAVERIIARRFEADQIDAPTTAPAQVSGDQ